MFGGFDPSKINGEFIIEQQKDDQPNYFHIYINKISFMDTVLLVDSTISVIIDINSGPI